MALILAKVSDDLLFASTVDDMHAVGNVLKERFHISNGIIDGPYCLMVA